jgi:hypothetical protein
LHSVLLPIKKHNKTMFFGSIPSSTVAILTTETSLSLKSQYFLRYLVLPFPRSVFFPQVEKRAFTSNMGQVENTRKTKT